MTTRSHDPLTTMTGITERTLAATFGWSSVEERLHRDCPTAFWLAPDGDEALPPTNGPTLPGPVVRTAVPAVTEAGNPANVSGQAFGIGVATVVAGPIFAPLAMLTFPGLESGWQDAAALVFGSIIISPVTALFGSVLAILPIMLGSLTLSMLGVRRVAARRRRLWAATGAGMGLAIAAAFDAGLLAIALVLTAAACATIAHRSVTWIDAQP